MTTSINGDWKTSEFYKIDGFGQIWKFWRVGTKYCSPPDFVKQLWTSQGEIIKTLKQP